MQHNACVLFDELVSKRRRLVGFQCRQRRADVFRTIDVALDLQTQSYLNRLTPKSSCEPTACASSMSSSSSPFPSSLSPSAPVARSSSGAYDSILISVDPDNAPVRRLSCTARLIVELGRRPFGSIYVGETASPRKRDLRSREVLPPTNEQRRLLEAALTVAYLVDLLVLQGDLPAYDSESVLLVYLWQGDRMLRRLLHLPHSAILECPPALGDIFSQLVESGQFFLGARSTLLEHLVLLGHGLRNHYGMLGGPAQAPPRDIIRCFLQTLMFPGKEREIRRISGSVELLLTLAFQPLPSFDGAVIESDARRALLDQSNDAFQADMHPMVTFTVANL